MAKNVTFDALENKDNKLIEQELAEDLKGLLKAGIVQLQEKAVEGFDASDVVKLEKLTRVYSILMSDLRETVKHGLLGSLDDEELDDLAQSP